MRKKVLRCMNLLTWGGKVCYGTSFTMTKEAEQSVKAVCDTCGKAHDLRHLMEEKAQ